MKKLSLLVLFLFLLAFLAAPAFATDVLVRQRIVTPFVPVVQTVVAAPVVQTVVAAPVVQQVVQPVQVQQVQQVQAVAVQPVVQAIAVQHVAAAFAVHSPVAVVAHHGVAVQAVRVQAVRFGGGAVVRQRVVIRR